MDRQNLVYEAIMAGETERYNDMAEAIKKVASMNVELTLEERKLLTTAYKNKLKARRTSCKVIRKLEKKVQVKGDTEKLELIEIYRRRIEAEVNDICLDVLKLLDKHIMPYAMTTESKAFYYRLKGDYYRYMAEITTDMDDWDAAENALASYDAAFALTMDDLSPAHQTSLELALNYSVYCYDILDLQHEACEYAYLAYNYALLELSDLSDEELSVSGVHEEACTSLMGRLQDNAKKWESELCNNNSQEMQSEEEFECQLEVHRI